MHTCTHTDASSSYLMNNARPELLKKAVTTHRAASSSHKATDPDTCEKYKFDSCILMCWHAHNVSDL